MKNGAIRSMGCTVIWAGKLLLHIFDIGILATTYSVFSVYEIKNLVAMFVHLGNVGKAKQI